MFNLLVAANEKAPSVIVGSNAGLAGELHSISFVISFSDAPIPRLFVFFGIPVILTIINFFRILGYVCSYATKMLTNSIADSFLNCLQ